MDEHEIVLCLDGVHRCSCGNPRSVQHGAAMSTATVECTDALLRFIGRLPAKWSARAPLVPS